MLRSMYLALCVAGTILPYLFLVPFLIEHGLDLPLFFEQLFVNRISSLFGIDFMISSIVLWIFVFREGDRLGMKNLWVCVAANLTVGISLALPLFLLMRQHKLDESNAFSDQIESRSL